MPDHVVRLLSLDLLSPEPCRPFDRARSGISIGEGAGFALLERARAAPVRLLGAGESSDAHHMSTPHPEGLGARLAMRGALETAGLRRSDRLHQPARHRDPLQRSRRRPRGGRRCSERTASSSTKGWFGHLLGAAGIVESIVALLALEHGLLPAR